MNTPGSNADFERRLANLELRLNWLDEHGTRGVGALQLQVAELLKDQGKIETQIERVNERIETNRKQIENDRKADEARRTAAFRWRVSAVIATIAAWGTVMGILIDLTSHLR